jgi:hypothetical protein
MSRHLRPHGLRGARGAEFNDCELRHQRSRHLRHRDRLMEVVPIAMLAPSAAFWLSTDSTALTSRSATTALVSLWRGLTKARLHLEAALFFGKSRS